jgi:hypothetical protein
MQAQPQAFYLDPLLAFIGLNSAGKMSPEEEHSGTTQPVKI